MSHKMVEKDMVAANCQIEQEKCATGPPEKEEPMQYDVLVCLLDFFRFKMAPNDEIDDESLASVCAATQAAMEGNRFDWSIQFQCCNILMRCAKNSSCVEIFVAGNNSLFRELLKTMKRYPDSAPLQIRVLLVIALLSRENSFERFHGSCGTMDHVEQILQSMARHKRNPFVQRLGIIIMANLNQSEDNQAVFFCNEGLQMLMSAMQRFPHDFNIHLVGLECVLMLTKTKSNVTALKKMGAKEIVITASISIARKQATLP